MTDAVRGKKDILGFPFVLCGMWLYFYGSLSYNAAVSLPDLLPTWTMEFGQFLALASLIGLLAGWHTYSKPFPRTRRNRLIIAQRYLPKVWTIGVALLGIAILSEYTFFGQETIDYSHTTNYWYLMFYAGYPAVALCILVIVKDNSKKGRWRKPILVILVITLMLHRVIQARRGPLVPMVVTLVYLPYLLRKKRPNRVVVSVSMILSGLMMLTFVYMRPYSYAPQGATHWTIADRIDGWKDGLRHLTWNAVVTEKQMTSSDNEYLYHCGMIATMWQLDDYQFGTGYLSLLTNWIPRQLWPSKPALEEGWFTSTWWAEMPTVMGWRMTNGAAGGGVADVFSQFGLATPVFWFLLGSAGARVYAKATRSDDILSTLQYVGFVATTHWLVAQGFGAMFVPACYCILIPTVILRRYQAPVNRRRSDGLPGIAYWPLKQARPSLISIPARNEGFGKKRTQV